MKAFITIEMEIPFTNEETLKLDEHLKESGKTLSYHFSRTIEEVLIVEASIKKEYIKEIKVNRVD